MIVNTIDAMHDKGLDVGSEEIRINLLKVHNDEGSSYCNLTVWNSGTRFSKPVMEQAGTRLYTTRPGRGRSGLGLYIIETLLNHVGAQVIEKGRHFSLANTNDPSGACIMMSLPITR